MSKNLFSDTTNPLPFYIYYENRIQIFSAKSIQRLTGVELISQFQLPRHMRLDQLKSLLNPSPKFNNDDCLNRYKDHIFSPTEHLYIEYISNEKEWGLKTNKALTSGEFVGLYFGELKPLIQIVAEENIKGKRNPYIMSLIPDIDFDSAEKMIRHAKDFFVDASQRGGYCRFLNHSNTPNCDAFLLWDDGLPLPIIRVSEGQNIQKGDELTFNYGAHYGQVIEKGL